MGKRGTVPDVGVTEALIGCWDVSGIANRAFTANRWSRRWSKFDTCSSNRKFSALNWCRQDNNDATVNYKIYVITLIFLLEIAII